MKKISLISVLLFASNLMSQWVPIEHNVKYKVAFKDSITNEKMTEFVFNQVVRLNGGYYLCQYNKFVGMINTKGEIIIPFNYSEIKLISKDSALVFQKFDEKTESFKIHYTDTGIWINETDFRNLKNYNIPQFKASKNFYPTFKQIANNQKPSENLIYDKSLIEKKAFEFKSKLEIGFNWNDNSQNYFNFGSAFYIKENSKNSMYGIGVGYRSFFKEVNIDTQIRIQSVPLYFSNIYFLGDKSRAFLRYDFGFYATQNLEFIDKKAQINSLNNAPKKDSRFLLNFGFGCVLDNVITFEILYSRISPSFFREELNYKRNTFMFSAGVLF